MVTVICIALSMPIRLLVLTEIHMQFGTHGNLEQHGFARNRFWTIDNNPPPLPVNPAIKAYVDLILKPSEEDLKIWPHRFVYITG
jgi:hypothetical protein